MFTLLSLNINGLRDSSKRAAFLQWLRSLPATPDFVCLQESHCVSSAECQSWFLSSGYSYVSSPGTHKSCGCIILFRPCFSLTSSQSDDSGRFLRCGFSFRNIVFRIVCVYAPNRNPDRDTFFDDTSSKMDPTIPTFLVGDFNTVFDRSVDRRGSVVTDVSRESSVALARLFNDSCCLDIWRYLLPTTQGFTWSRADGLVSSRIDLIGCPYAWTASASSCDIVPCPFSDHCALVLSIDPPNASPPGPGLWKINSAVLQDSAYASAVSDFWLDWRSRKGDFSSLAKWWDVGKSKIKGLTISYCVRRSQRRKQTRSLLSRLAGHLKERLDAGMVSCLGPYQAVLGRLAKLDMEAAKGAQVRSRVKWVEEGEVSSAFFCRLEKKKSMDRWVSALRLPDDSIISDPADLCSSFSDFYSSLYSASETDASAQETLLANLPTPLSPELSDPCEGPLTTEECYLALGGMSRGKAPGSDGFTSEFYCKFWDLVGPDLVEVLNSCYFHGSLSLSQRRGVISLLFKKGDRLDPRNWRPISLLNVDYKIASRVIAGRLLKVIHAVVHTDQTCGVPGRFIGENVAFLRDVVDYATDTNSPVAVLSLDQEKAFDRVDWSFMRSVLVSMGFGSSFVRWVKLFYTNVQSCVNVNGYLSPFFSLSRGVRQGCPLSPLLYVLVSEVLAVNIRANPRITGLSLPGAPASLSPISQYADDTSIIVTSDDSIRAVFETFSLFEQGSGAKLNQSKSKGLWLGCWRGRLDPPVALDWSSDGLKILGVFIGPGDLESANWRPRLDAIANVLHSWRQRSLSYSGRALVINTLALSRLWYVASLIPVPEWVYAELLKQIYQFFWAGKRDLVARVVVVQPPSAGGFSVVDPRLKTTSLLVQWVRRLVVSPNSWTSFLSYWCSVRLGSSVHDVLSSPFVFSWDPLPPFYRALLSAWRSVDGAWSPTRGSLVLASSSPFHVTLASELSAQSVYRFLLSENRSSPHCVLKFFPVYGQLYWSSTWCQLYLFPLDRQVLDLNWKVAHGVLYTADRLLGFGYSIDPLCFCGLAPECPSHLFFSCPLAQSVLSWLQSLLFSFSPVCPSLVCRHALFGFNPGELRSVPRIFVYLLNVCKYFIWLARNDFRFRDIHPGALEVIAKVRARVRFHLPIFFRRFKSPRRQRRFHRQWGASGIIGRVNNGSFSFSDF